MTTLYFVNMAMSTSSKVIIIGAGIGGLSCALALASKGIETLVIDKNNHIGGKMRQVNIDGKPIDAGPTVLTMKWVFDALFENAQVKLEDYVHLEQAKILARHAWRDHSQLDLFADPELSAKAIGEFSDSQNKEGFLRFLAHVKKIHQTTKQPFIVSEKPTLVSIFKKYGLKALPLFMATQSYKTLWNSLDTFFSDPKLKQLFARYATYTGSSPFLCPATLSLIAHVEMNGVWRVQGGMHALAIALKKRFIELGGTILLEKNISKIHTNKQSIQYIETDEGAQIHAKAFVFNGDVAALPALFGKQKQAQSSKKFNTRSLSALTWCALAKTKKFPLLHHNVFFSNQYKKEFQEIFQSKTLPTEPTTYICAQDRGDNTQPLQQERLLILVNAPATGDFKNNDKSSAFSDHKLQSYTQKVLDHLETCGLHISTTERQTIQTSPKQWNTLFPHTGGALYGHHSHGMTSFFKRPGAKTNFKNLFVAGGSTHPGAGVPMASLSGQIAAKELCKTLPHI